MGQPSPDLTPGHPAPATVGQLRASGYASRSAAEELRANLLNRLRSR